MKISNYLLLICLPLAILFLSIYMSDIYDVVCDRQTKGIIKFFQRIGDYCQNYIAIIVSVLIILSGLLKLVEFCLQ